MPAIRFPQSVSAKEAMLCWNPKTDEVAIYQWPDTHDHSHRYAFTALACYAATKDMTFEQLKALCFIEAMHLIIRDKCDPQAVHRALMAVDEYRDGLSDDCK